MRAYHAVQIPYATLQKFSDRCAAVLRESVCVFVVANTCCCTRLLFYGFYKFRFRAPLDSGLCSSKAHFADQALASLIALSQWMQLRTWILKIHPWKKKSRTAEIRSPRKRWSKDTAESVLPHAKGDVYLIIYKAEGGEK